MNSVEYIIALTAVAVALIVFIILVIFVSSGFETIKRIQNNIAFFEAGGTLTCFDPQAKTYVEDISRENGYKVLIFKNVEYFGKDGKLYLISRSVKK